MLIFLDTEYTDLLNCDLINIGMVSEDGQYELYLERSDYERQWCNSFVHAAVLPQLGNAGPALDRDQLAVQLTMWFLTLPRSLTIACDSFTDWELLLDALGDVRPPNLISRYDLRAHVDSSVFHLLWFDITSAMGHGTMRCTTHERIGTVGWHGTTAKGAHLNDPREGMHFASTVTHHQLIVFFATLAVLDGQSVSVA